jgi:hypothetical protein
MTTIDLPATRGRSEVELHLSPEEVVRWVRQRDVDEVAAGRPTISVIEWRCAPADWILPLSSEAWSPSVSEDDGAER